VILAEWAPLLAALGIAPAMAAAAARHRVWRLLTHPGVALPLWLVSYYTWHVPPVYDAALHHQSSLIHLEHACYFATGFLFWWPLVQDEPHHLPSGFRAVYAFAAFVLAAPLGLLLALIPRAIYPYYEHAPRIWGLNPLADQELAGATMAAEQALVLFVAFAYWFSRFLAEEGAA
jgi:cytochrome c oxidase assembly factor CtaG